MSIWTGGGCGCGISTCCRLDGVCCKKQQCKKTCNDGIRVKLSDVNAVFYTTDIVGAWQGIRWLRQNGVYIMVGTQGSSGIVNIGPFSAFSVSTYSVNFPNAVATSVYGPDVPNVNAAPIRLVGTYRNNNDATVFGFYYSGTVEDLNTSSNYSTLKIGPTYTFAHSIMGDIIVGTYDNESEHNTFNLPLGPINAFVYNVKNGTTDNLHFPGSISNAAYGVWHNGGTRYTICGGYSNSAIDISSVYVGRNGVALPVPFGNAFLVDYDSRTRRFCNWACFKYPEQNIVTHFQGISAVSNRKCNYQLAADSADISTTNVTQGSWVEVRRKKDKCGTRTRFPVKKWININFPNAGLNAANTVAGNVVLGLAEVDNEIIPYQTQLLIDGFFDKN